MFILKTLESTKKPKYKCFVSCPSPPPASLLSFLPALKTKGIVSFHQSCDPATVIKLGSVFQDPTVPSETRGHPWFVVPIPSSPSGWPRSCKNLPRSRLAYFRILCLVLISRAVSL